MLLDLLWFWITAIRHWMVLTLTFHNLAVRDLHTYYVLAGDTPVLVHNCGERIYEAGGKRGREARGSSRGENSAEPADGQCALDNSVQIKATSPGEVPCGCTVDGGTNEIFHGHVRTDINSDPAMQQAQSALRRGIKSGDIEEP